VQEFDWQLDRKLSHPIGGALLPVTKMQEPRFGFVQKYFCKSLVERPTGKKERNYDLWNQSSANYLYVSIWNYYLQFKIYL